MERTAGSPETDLSLRPCQVTKCGLGPAAFTISPWSFACLKEGPRGTLSQTRRSAHRGAVAAPHFWRRPGPGPGPAVVKSRRAPQLCCPPTVAATPAEGAGSISQSSTWAQPTGQIRPCWATVTTLLLPEGPHPATQPPGNRPVLPAAQPPQADGLWPSAQRPGLSRQPA